MKNCLSLVNYTSSLVKCGIIELLSCICLTRSSRNYILRHFGKLITQEKLADFINIPFEEIDKIISSDDLNVYKEEQVFEGIIHWTKGNSKDRLSHIGEY